MTFSGKRVRWNLTHRRRKMDYTKVDLAMFVAEWEQADEVAPIANKFKMTPAECSRLAAVLRKKGVELKKFREPVQLDIEVAALRKLLKKK